MIRPPSLTTPPGQSGQKGQLLIIVPLLPLLPLLPPSLEAQSTRPDITLATTTSVRDSRLFEHILPEFERRSGIGVRVIAVGSGQAIELGRRGEADILLVHDPAAELDFIEDGHGVERTPLMYNEFVLVGPAGDPAGVRGATIIEALRQIVTEAQEAEEAGGLRRVRFVSRADRSGTHSKEMTLWRMAGVPPHGRWYRESGQGMSATLQIANELQAYALTDVGTFSSHHYPLDLAIAVEGDSLLFNPYHVLLPNPARFPWIDVAGAQALLEYLTAPDTRDRIRAFGRERFGRSLFLPAER